MKLMWQNVKLEKECIPSLFQIVAPRPVHLPLIFCIHRFSPKTLPHFSHLIESSSFVLPQSKHLQDIYLPVIFVLFALMNLTTHLFNDSTHDTIILNKSGNSIKIPIVINTPISNQTSLISFHPSCIDSHSIYASTPI